MSNSKIFIVGLSNLTNFLLYLIPFSNTSILPHRSSQYLDILTKINIKKTSPKIKKNII